MEICGFAFYCCEALKEVTIPATALFIGESAFIGTGITSVIFENTTDWLANKDVELTSEQLSDTSNAAKLLRTYFLNKGYGDTDWERPSLIYTLSSDGTYYTVGNNGTTSRSQITIPETYNNKPVKALAANAFKDCAYLSSITLPGQITSIGNGAFDGCTSLESIDVTSYLISDFTPVYASSNGILYNADYSEIVYVPLGKTSISISSSITTIKESTFKNCNSLKTINYTGDLAGWCGISGLENLTTKNFTICINGKKLEGELIIPDGVTSISCYAFYNCRALTKVVIPESVTSIGNYALKHFEII